MAHRKPTTSIRAISGIFRAVTAHCSSASARSRCHFILIFDNGYFSEFGTFSITDWLGHAPKVAAGQEFWLARIGVRWFSDQGSLLRPWPRAAGEMPANRKARDGAAADAQVSAAGRRSPMRIHKGGREWRVGVERFPISTTITGVVLDLEPGALRELHWHPNADEWQYVIDGEST